MKYALSFAVFACAGVLGLLLHRFADPAVASPPAASAAAAVASERRPEGAAPARLPAAGDGVARAAAAGPPGEPGAISGIVEDAAGAPIAGATCRVWRGSAPLGLAALVARPSPARDGLASARSDARGAFRIEVPPGFWTLRVEAGGTSPWEESALQPGDARRVRMRPVRELVVRVRDGLGRPIARADVSVLRGAFRDPRSARTVARTDAHGNTPVMPVPSGTWHVHVGHPDHVAVVQPAPAAAGGAATLDVVLARGVRVVGSVALAGGAPLPAPARILFETLDGFRSSHEVETDASGRYASARVFAPHRPLEVAALAPGFGEARREVRLGAVPPSGEVVVDLVFEMLERQAVGRVVDADGAPVAEAEIHVKPLLLLPPETTIRIPSGPELLEHGLPDLTAFDPQESQVARLRRAAATDAGGRFRIDGLHPAKAYQVLVVSEKHANATLWIEAGEPGGTFDLGTVALGRAGRVHGYVRRPDGSPIEGALVYTAAHTRLQVEPDSELKTQRPRVLRGPLDAISNEDGSFAIEPFPAAEFQLMCNGRAFGPFELAAGATLGPLELVTEDTHRLASDRAATVVLRVLDGASEPVGGVYADIVRIRADAQRSGGDDFMFHDWTYALGDATGRVELRAEPGRYEVRVKDLHGLFEPRAFAADVPAEGLARDVYLAAKPTPAPVLAGVVRTAAGVPVPDLQVLLIPETGDVSCHCLKLDVRTDAEGAFTFGRFMPGDHRIIVNDPTGHMRPVHHYPARAGDPIVVTLR